MLQMRSLPWMLLIVTAVAGYMIADPVLTPRKTLSLEPGGYALDIGCGTGESTMDVLRNNPGMTLVGIDNDEAMIRYAKKRYPEPLFLCQDAAEPVFAPRVFDLVQMRFCLFCIRDENVIHEAWRVMKNDGRLVVIDYDPQHPYAREVLACSSQTLDRMAGGDPYRYAGLLRNRFEVLDSRVWDGVFSTVYRKKSTNVGSGWRL